MTNTQLNTLKGLTSFANNIGKLSIGRSTTFVRQYSDGTEHKYAKVRCDTVGRRPRLFTVSSDGFNMPSGGGYTYKKIMENLFNNIA